MKLLKKRLFFFIGPKGASANYVHVDDVINSLMLCISSPQAINQTYIVSNWSSMEEMICAMCSELNVSIPKIRIPILLAKFISFLMCWLPQWPLTTNRIDALSNRSRYSTEKIERELGWKPKIPISVGIKKLLKK